MKRLLVVLMALSACSSGPSTANVVDSMASDVMVPLVEATGLSMAELAVSVDEFCTDPSESTLRTAQDAWRRAKTDWETAEVTIYTGPAAMLRTQSYVDFEPASREGVEELLASDAVIDFDYVENRSAASRRGLGSIELGLFKPLPEASDPRQCELTTAAAAVAADAVAAMESGWVDGAGDAPPYLETFSSTMDSNAAIADVVGAQSEILKRQTLFELGAALGVSAPEPDLLAIPEGPAGAGVARYVAQLSGIEAAVDAGGDESLLELIRSRSAVIAERLETSLTDARAKLAQFEGPLVTAVQEQPELATGLLQDLTEARDLLGVDVVSLLDLTLGFSDSDGDTG